MDHRRRAIAIRFLTILLMLASSAPSPAAATTCTLSAGTLHVVLGDSEHVDLSTDGTLVTTAGTCDFTGEVLSVSVSSSAAGSESVAFLDAASASWDFPIAISGVEVVELRGTGSAEVLDARAFPFTLSGVTTLVIHAYGGADVVTAIPTLQMEVWAGEGDDQVFGSRRSDNVYGEEGNDFVRGERGGDYIVGGLGADTLYGDSGADTLEGGEDDDRLYGGSGDDHMSGDAGADTLFSGGGTDYLDGGEGFDACEGFGTAPPRRSKVTYLYCES